MEWISTGKVLPKMYPVNGNPFFLRSKVVFTKSVTNASVYYHVGYLESDQDGTHFFDVNSDEYIDDVTHWLEPEPSKP